MLAQVTLTPTESKQLIGKAVVQMEEVKNAAKKGTILMHPCSTTFFVFQELTGHRPPTEVWSCGITVPKGECTELGVILEGLMTMPEEKSALRDPRNYLFHWILRQGKFSWKERLGDLIEEMTPDSVYIKGANAIDMEGKAGVLIGNPSEEFGGSIAVAMAGARQKGYKMIFAVGLEKLIPGQIKEISKVARRREYSYAMGLPCGLLPVEGIVVTEVEAIRILTGATAVPIAAGGIGGAEGAVVLAIKGEDDQVKKAIEYAEQSKGAKLPETRTRHCYDCPMLARGDCFGVKDKHWVT